MEKHLFLEMTEEKHLQMDSLQGIAYSHFGTINHAKGDFTDRQQNQLAQLIEKTIRDIDDTCVDNLRFYFDDDKEGYDKYMKAREDGCCGFYDDCLHVSDEGVTTRVYYGFNYGH